MRRWAVYAFVRRFPPDDRVYLVVTFVRKASAIRVADKLNQLQREQFIQTYDFRCIRLPRKRLFRWVRSSA